MNEKRFQELLADYLAGELDEQQATAFRAELESHPERRQLARELQAAAAALEANVLSEEESRRRTESLHLPEMPRPIRLGCQRLKAVLRYAAVIVLAFGAGFVARGWQPSVAEPASPPPPAMVAATSINEHYVTKYQKAAQAFPKSSSLSHTLLTLARP